MVRIVVAPTAFSDWGGLLELLRSSFAYMASRIDPPSSLDRIDLAGLRQMAREETLLLALAGERAIACAFAKEIADALYVGKVAVDSAFRGRGLARRLMAEAEALARAKGLPFLELQTRVELVENHRAFAALGFLKTGETAHPGYDRPTSITMRRRVPA